VLIYHDPSYLGVLTTHQRWRGPDYEQQRRAMLKKHGIDLEEPSVIRKRTLRRKELEMVLGKKWLEDGDGLLTWRDKKRRKMALSVCGCVSRSASVRVI
jgi:hypothetical protein